MIITVAGWPDDDRGIIQRFAMVATTRFAVGDLLGSVGPLATDPAESVAQWRDGDRLITVRGNLTPDAVAAIAQTVGPATDDGVQQRLEAGLTSLPQVGFGTRHTIFSGVIGDGYTATVAVSARTDLAGYVWWIGQPDASVQPRLVAGDGGVTIDTRVEHGRTYVMAKVPRSEAGAVLRVNPTGLPTVELTLVDIDPQLPDLFAAYVFVEPVTYTAQVVGNDGEPLTVWPTA